MKFHTWAILSLISIANPILAQKPTFPRNFASPTAASLGVYGDIGVNYFTGSPNVSVKLYEVAEGDVKIPIDLTYSSSQVKPNNHPGWNGLGWSLGCLGQITRIQKFYPDERSSTEEDKYKNAGFFYSYAVLNKPDWSAPIPIMQLYLDMTRPIGTNFESEADDFSFNIPGGYSGKFQWGHDGKWHVTCDADIKVEFNSSNGFITPSEFRTKIYDPMKTRTKVVQYSDKYFNKFTLITPDGTRYDFGGRDATEYSVSYRGQGTQPVIPTTWMLTKITTITGRVVDLYYHEGPLICTLFRGSSYNRKSVQQQLDWGPDGNCSGNVTEYIKRSGFLTFPVYLDSIKSSIQTIVFEHSNSKELRYDDFDIKLGTGDGDGHYVYFQREGNGDDTKLDLQLQWQKLDKIKIKYLNNQLLKEFNFNYTNSEATRLKLLSVQEKDKNGIAKPPYQFTYKPSTFLNYCWERVDHWGFNNSFDPTGKTWSNIDQFINIYINSKEPDTTGVFCQSELLDTLKYPTSGFTVFEFEPHNYSKVVNKDRVSFSILAKALVAGGVRIKRIKSYTEKNAVPLIKEYLYLNNYLGQSNTSTLSTSGTLGGLFEYKWMNYTGKDFSNNNFTYDQFSSFSVLPSPSNANGSHIGYTEVIELTKGAGFTKYTFTNYDTKVGDNYPHMDEAAIYNTVGNRSIYSPYTSKVDERGKVKKIETFNKYNQKVKEVNYNYSRSSDSFLRGLEYSSIYLCNDEVFFGTAYKRYEYSYLLTSEIGKIYPTDDPGNENKALINFKSYEYNMNRKLVKATIQLQSDSSKIITHYNYPFDYDYTTDTTGTYLKNMAADNVNYINAVVEQKLFKQEKNGTTNLLDGTINHYNQKYLPAKTYRLELSSPAPSSYTSYNNHPPGNNKLLIPANLPYNKDNEFKYDKYGNVTEVKEAGKSPVSYVYSYNYLFPVAIILNATNQEVATALGYNSYAALSNAIGLSYTDVIKTKVNSLRTLITKARITTATYDPLLGITSIINESGRATYYQYDNFNRMQLIKDNENNIIKAFRYNYKTNP